MTRPTVIVSYGEYGYRILHSLLSNSSERGLLKWNSSKKIDGKKSLRNLELIWLTKYDEYNVSRNRKIRERLRNLNDQIYRDLYQQIKIVSISDGSIKPLKNAIDNAQERLLSPDQLIQTDGQVISSLDVFFLASLDEDNESLPALDAIMYPFIEHINEKNKHFVNQFDSSPRLNFIEILDYNRLSSETDEVISGRYELKQSIEGWQSTRKNGSSRGFGRVYICDGTSKGTYRNIDLRRKEVVLFLEFLLFESIREGELKHLFESKPDKSILASFGIRLGEQNIEALSQYAAADFSQGWVSYLSGHDIHDTVMSSAEIQTKNTIEKINIKNISNKIKLDSKVKTEIQTEISMVKQQLVDRTELNFDDILEKLEITFINAEAKAAQSIAALLADIRKKELATFKIDLLDAISYDLNESRYPIPVGKLIDIIDENINEIKIKQKEQSNKNKNREDFFNISYMHKTLGKFYKWYADFVLNRIDTNKTDYTWLGMSFILSMLFMPSIMYMLLHIEQSTLDIDFIIENPIFIFIFLFIFFKFSPKKISFAGRCQKYISNKLKYANDWFIDAIRGRLIHALNDVGQNNKLVGKLYDDVYSSLYSEVLQSLYEVRTLLIKRRLEMWWLVKSLPDLKLKLEPSDGGFREEAPKWDGASYRYDIRNNNDLKKIQNRLPPDKHKFADRIGEAPNFFNDWQKRYDSVFLSPLHIINQLSKLYSKPFYEEVLSDKEGHNTEAIMTYLNYQSQNLSVGLDFLQQEGFYESMKYALLSNEFSGIEKVEMQILNNFDIDKSQIIELKNPLRIYLLSIKLGINQKVLGHIE